MKRFLVAALACSSVGLVLAPTAAADDTTCVGVLPPGTYDNVVVPPGATCNLMGTTVRGNAKALANSRLFFNGGDTVHGDVVGAKAQTVSAFALTVRGNFEGDETEVVACTACTVRGNFVASGGDVDDPGDDARIGPGTTVLEGNVQLYKTVGDVGVFSTNVQKGSVQLFENLSTGADPIPGPFAGVMVLNSVVAHGLQVIKNRGPGPKNVSGNNVGQSVQCFENDPPFVGGPNAAPKKEGQCF